MKITFRQSGGYAGLIRGCEIDTHTLPADEAAAIESLVNSSGVLTAKSAHSRVGRDLFSYSITIESREGQQQLEFDDSTIPVSAGPLLDFLRMRAGPRPLR
jgi:hypothetical protein